MDRIIGIKNFKIEVAFNQIIVKMDDFMDVIKEMEPSALREVFVEVPDIKWENVGGLDHVHIFH